MEIHDELKAKDALYGSSQHSTLIYATAVPGSASTKTSNIKAPGFYYYDNGTGKWEAVIKEAVTPKFFYMPYGVFILVRIAKCKLPETLLPSNFQNGFRNHQISF